MREKFDAWKSMVQHSPNCQIIYNSMNTVVTTCMENCKELVYTYTQSYITYLQWPIAKPTSLIGHITFHKKSWLHINICGVNLLFTVIYRHSLCTTFTILLFINTSNAKCKNRHISYKVLVTIWLLSWKQKDPLKSVSKKTEFTNSI